MEILKPVFLFFFLIWSTDLVFSQQNDVPVIENSNQIPIQYCFEPVAIASLISFKNIQADTDNKGIKISISNYKQGEDILVYDAIDSFQYSWNENIGYLEITGTGTDSDYEQAVSMVYYQNLSLARTVGIRSLSISLRNTDYFPGTGHFYRFVEAHWLSWSAAKDQASSMNFYGLQGYLATIRSKEEQDFIMTKTRGTGWIGASDNEKEGTWMWVQGPDSGVVFWSGNWRGHSVNNEYSNWRFNEPNNQYPDDYAHIMYTINNGYWNDLPNVGSGVEGYIPQGYIMEYGGMPDDPEVKLSAIAYIEVRERVHPELDMNNVKFLFCDSNLTQNFNIAFINGEPETKLTSLDSRVIVNDSSTYSPSITVPEYGVYYFQLDMVDEATCSYTDTISIEFRKKPEASFSLDKNECYDYDLPLAYTGNTEEGTLFTWYYNENEYRSGMGLDSVNMQLEVSNSEHTVGLRVNEQGCINFISSSVKVKPNIKVTIQNAQGCSPLEVHFEPVINKSIQTFSWDFTDGSVSKEKYPWRTFVNKTDSVLSFDVQLTVYSEEGCDNTAVFKDMVKVYPVPKAEFNYLPEEVLITNPVVTFNNSSRAATSYLWDFGDSITVSNKENPVHRYESMGVYSVFLETYNDFGCRDSLNRQVKVGFEKIFAPNAFSPHASFEEDWEFRLYGEGVADTDYQLLIFNRWGQVVFKSNSQNEGWDGRMKNSDFAPAGVYTWILQYSDFSGDQRKQQGTVTLLF